MHLCFRIDGGAALTGRFGPTPVLGPMVAAEIRKSRIGDIRSSRRRWHLDETFVKSNGG